MLDHWCNAFLSGTVKDQNGQSVINCVIIAIDVTDVLLQFRAQTDQTGSFRFPIRNGTYDVIFDAVDFSTTIYTSITVTDDSYLYPSLEEAKSSLSTRIHGSLQTTDNQVCPGWIVTAYPMNSTSHSAALAQSESNSSGYFSFDIEDSQYLMIRCYSPDLNNCFQISVPKPNKPIYIHLRYNSELYRNCKSGMQLIHQSGKESCNSSPNFHVCQYKSENNGLVYQWWRLTGGILNPEPLGQGSWLMCDLPPIFVAIWVEDMGHALPYRISVDNSINALPSAPKGTYHFYDEEGDKYMLFANLPMVHTLLYYSNKPNILKLEVTQSFSNFWPNAPQC